MVPSVLERKVAAAQEAVRDAVAGLDPDDLTPHEAGTLFEALDRVVRTATAGCTLLARRVEDGQEWKRKGYRSAAEHLAAIAGTSLGAARRQVDTSKALRDLPRVRDEMVEGAISPDQGEAIVDGAKVNPSAQGKLLDAAKRANLQELRHEALKARAAADPSPEATHERLHTARRVARFTDGEGARHLNITGPVDAVSVIEAALRPAVDLAHVHG